MDSEIRQQSHRPQTTRRPPPTPKTPCSSPPISSLPPRQSLLPAKTTGRQTPQRRRRLRRQTMIQHPGHHAQNTNPLPTITNTKTPRKIPTRQTKRKSEKTPTTRCKLDRDTPWLWSHDIRRIADSMMGRCPEIPALAEQMGAAGHIADSIDGPLSRDLLMLLRSAPELVKHEGYIICGAPEALTELAPRA